MLQEIDFSSAKTIVELGAGSGSFTREILKKLRPDAKFIVFEIDEVFIKKLSKLHDPRMIIIKDSAENLSKYLDREADYIVSGIPLSNLSKSVKSGIISASEKNLKKGGLFLQFQYIPESLNFLKKYFPFVKLRFTFLNTPPAFFYVCKK